MRIITRKQYESLLTAVKPVPECSIEDLPNPEVRLLPALRSAPDAEPDSPESSIYPLFPLGGTVYLPTTHHVLNIFEPRYRKMYNDILFSGSRQFAVCYVSETGQFAEIATVFYLEDLKEVSQQTNDQVKYVCKHKCTKRVRIRKVLNPEAWSDASTYLRVEAEELDDVVMLPPTGALDAADLSKNATALQPSAGDDEWTADKRALCAQFDDVIALQDSFKEEPRFSPALKGVFTADDIVETKGDEKLWALATLWQTFASERIRLLSKKGSQEIESKLLAYITKNGTISPNSLAGKELEVPTWLQKEIARMTSEFRREMSENEDSTTVPYQQMLQAESRGERIRILRRVVVEEMRRLEAKKSLRDLFLD
jgi:hypothetical protein